MSYSKSKKMCKATMYFDGLIVFPVLIHWGVSQLRLEKGLSLPLVVLLSVIPISLFIAWVVLYVAALIGEKNGNLKTDTGE